MEQKYAALKYNTHTHFEFTQVTKKICCIEVQY